MAKLLPCRCTKVPLDLLQLESQKLYALLAIEILGSFRLEKHGKSIKQTVPKSQQERDNSDNYGASQFSKISTLKKEQLKLMSFHQNMKVAISSDIKFSLRDICVNAVSLFD